MRTWFLCGLTFAAGALGILALERALPATPKNAPTAAREVPMPKPAITQAPVPFTRAAAQRTPADPQSRKGAEETFHAAPEGDPRLAERRIALQAAVQSTLGRGSALRDVECRGTTCKVTVAHTGREGREAFMGSISEHPPKGFAAMRLFQSEEAGSTDSVLFVDQELSLSDDAETDPEPTLDGLSSKFAAEAPDEARANLATRSLEASLQGFSKTGTVEDVECRSATCKVTVLHGSAAEQAQFLSSYAEKPPADSAGMRTFPLNNADGVRTVLFVSRMGGAS